jgi:transposase
MTITDDKITWIIKTDKIKEDEKLDGLYVIRSDVSKSDMSADEVVRAYKDLIHVEQAFRMLKTTRLEIRPIYHHTEDRMRAHVFLCMLSYYLLRHMNQRLSPLYKDDSEGKNHKFTIGFVIETLKAIRKENIQFCGAKSVMVTTPNEDQQKILNLLEISIL